MKHLIIYSFFMFCAMTVIAQKQTFDLTSYTPPKGWAVKKSDKAIQFTKQDNSANTYCIITVYKSIDAPDDGKVNFDASWESLVKDAMTVADEPTMQPVSNEDGWEARSGYSTFESDGSKGIALLVSTTGYQKVVNILILTNTDSYENAITQFLESATFKKPAAKPLAPKENPAVKPAPGKQDGYAFSTTNFDDGWTSVIQDEWVLTTKGNTKVYIYYALPFDVNYFTGTGRVERDFYWDTYVAKQFQVLQKQYRDDGEVIGNLKPKYVEGTATDPQTGETRFIAMRLSIAPNTAYLIIASAPDEATMRQQFPKANNPYRSDLAGMDSYNKFAVAASDLTGQWRDGNTSTMHWAYVTPSGYEGYAGMTFAATASTFTFNGNGTYSSTHKGATGAVGAMSTFQQAYKGKSTVANWSVTLTNRFNGKTDVFNASFEIIKGGRILHLAGGGQTYNLLKH
jgi:hypothetical protein